MVQEFSSNEVQSLIDTSRRKKCKACGLYLNQLPVLDKQKKSNIFWVGLSSVLITEEEKIQPLSPYTRSGALINEIERSFTDDISFYKTILFCNYNQSFFILCKQLFNISFQVFKERKV